jgi:hypothetical protein
LVQKTGLVTATLGTGGTYHTFNSATGIWVDYQCTAGTGWTCTSETATTVGAALLVSNVCQYYANLSQPCADSPLPTGITVQTCPYVSHNQKDSSGGTGATGFYAVFTAQANVYPQCDFPNHFQVWNINGAFNATTSVSAMYSGLNHWAAGQNQVEAFTQNGQATGVFTTIYPFTNPTVVPGFSVYLQPQTNPYAQFPVGCYTNPTGTQQPNCSLGAVLDMHPACGVAYNYATLDI